MTVYQCDICRKWYTGETGWIVCPRCGSKERELRKLTDAIADAVAVTRHPKTGKILEVHDKNQLVVLGLHDRIEARLKELGI